MCGHDNKSGRQWFSSVSYIIDIRSRLVREYYSFSVGILLTYRLDVPDIS